MYARFLTTVRDATKGKWKPDMLMADMEGGIHAGINLAFGGRTKSRKCWFHVTQAIMNHTKQKGFVFNFVFIFVFIFFPFCSCVNFECYNFTIYSLFEFYFIFCRKFVYRRREESDISHAEGVVLSRHEGRFPKVLEIDAHQYLPGHEGSQLPEIFRAHVHHFKSSRKWTNTSSGYMGFVHNSTNMCG